MATESTVQPVSAGIAAFNQPYPPSWIDHLMNWIERLPGQAWLFYGVIFVLVIVVNNGLRWLEGSLPFGTFHPVRTTDALFPIYFPALMGYLNNVAAKSLDSFRPLLNMGDAEVARLRYQLTTIPKRVGLAVVVVALILSPLTVAADPVGFGLEPSSSILVVLFEIALTFVTAIFLFAFIYHTIHQLVLVNRIHQAVTRINLFNLAPTYAFSRLTVRTGIGLVFFSYYLFAAQQEPAPAQADVGADLIGLGLIFTTLVLSAASFILPLSNMHRLLVEEKVRMVGDANRRLEATLDRLYEGVDTEHLENMDPLNKAMMSLVAARDMLKKISTWPWEPGTSQAFATAIILPIVLWLLTRLLDQIITF